MFSSGALSDVTLNANGVSLRAHKLVLAACSQYFAQIFKDVDDTNTVVVIVDCDASDLRQLLTFMYTGEVTAAKKRLPSLLKLAHSLQVSGLTDSVHNPSTEPIENEIIDATLNEEIDKSPSHIDLETPVLPTLTKDYLDIPKLSQELQTDKGLLAKNDKLSKLDQIVQNLYSSHNIGSFVPAPAPVIPNLAEATRELASDKKWRSTSQCPVCHKRLSNQYNLRVHLDTHAGRRHACRACPHVSRSRDALRKHVAYRHAHAHLPPAPAYARPQ